LFFLREHERAHDGSNIIEEIGMYDKEQSLKTASKYGIVNVKNFKPRFYIVTLFFTCFFDAEKITLNGEIIFEKT
jgi:hypothetical protein